MKKLGFGMMRPPMKGDEIDFSLMEKMVDRYIEKGFTYFDTAPTYLNGGSEIMVCRTVIQRHPRERVQVASKLPLWVAEEKGLSLEEIWQGSMERTQAGYFDYYLLHAMNRRMIGIADRIGAWDFVQKKKAEGLVRHAGFSFHDTPEVLEEILSAHPELEFVQLQINYADWENPRVQSRECYEIARQHHKPIIVMEPVKGGTLACLAPENEAVLRLQDPEASIASWAVRYAASLDGVMMVLSGMSMPEQVEDNVRFMEDFRPFSEEERRAVAVVQEAMQNAPQIACTACGYCIDGCPQKIQIPRIFQAYNHFMTYGNEQIARELYESAVREKGRATECLQCGRCEGHCPQKLTIIEYLQQAGKTLE